MTLSSNEAATDLETLCRFTGLATFSHDMRHRTDRNDEIGAMEGSITNGVTTSLRCCVEDGDRGRTRIGKTLPGIPLRRRLTTVGASRKTCSPTTAMVSNDHGLRRSTW